MNLPTQPLKAVLFDLDDTLYDHLFSARHGLRQLSGRYAPMRDVPLAELEERYSQALETVHVRLLRGELGQTEARTIRMRQLFDGFGIQVSDEQALAEYRQFRQDYDSVCRCVPGAEAVLKAVRAAGLRQAVVTNNLVSEQIPKLKRLGIDGFFEVLAISEEVGVPKPDPTIFDVTLQRLGLEPTEVVMVGDSLTSDIAGALGVGIRAVWLQRQTSKDALPPDGVAVIREDFAQHDAAIRCILGAE